MRISLLLAAVFCCAFACRSTGPKLVTKPSTPAIPSKLADTPSLAPDPFSTLVDIETPYGVMNIELFFHAERHRENFLTLAKNKYYDSLQFHRVIKNFMIQGGDPESRHAPAQKRLGGGGPGYEQEAEINSRYFHVKGALAAARMPDEINPQKKSSGSQFYLVHGGSVTDEQLDRIERRYNFAYSSEQRRLYRFYGGAPQLDMEYTVFGRVYQGLNVLDSIALQETDASDRPKRPMWMVVKVR